MDGHHCRRRRTPWAPPRQALLALLHLPRSGHVPGMRMDGANLMAPGIGPYPISLVLLVVASRFLHCSQKEPSYWFEERAIPRWHGRKKEGIAGVC